MSFSGGSLISRIGARARANENHWAKKEQELELQKRNKKKKEEEDDDDDDDEKDGRKKPPLLLKRRARDDANEGEDDYYDSAEYDGVTKLAEVYANELRLSAQLEARELRKHKRFDVGEGNNNRGGQRRAFPENDNMLRRRRRDRWGFEAIKSDLEFRRLERQNASATERLAARRMHEVHKSTNAAAVRALVYASCLAVCGVVGGSVCASAFLDIASVEDLRNATKRNFEPTVNRIRERVEAYNNSNADGGTAGIEALNGGINRMRESLSGKRANFLDKVEESEFVLALRRVFRMKEKNKPPKNVD